MVTLPALERTRNEVSEGLLPRRRDLRFEDFYYAKFALERTRNEVSERVYVNKIRAVFYAVVDS